jgi:hypothetical protein
LLIIGFGSELTLLKGDVLIWFSTSVGLGETFSGSFSGRGIGPGAWGTLDDLFAAIGSEVIASVVEFASERIDRDNEVCMHRV